MRSHGEGSVFQRADGKWVARVEAGRGRNGRRRRRERIANTRREATKLLRELQEQLRAVDNIDGPRRTVAEAVEAFIATKDFETDSTEELYRWRSAMIGSGLGHIRIGQLTVDECDQFLAMAQAGDFGSQPNSADGVRRIRRLLIKSLHNEMRLGNISRNVAELSLRPESNQSTRDLPDEDGDNLASVRRTLTYDEYRRIWEVARHPAAVIVDLCGRNGLRPSEARGLTWECVDLDAMTIRIDKQANSKGRLTRTKTKRARRVISFDSTTGMALETWRTEWEEALRRAGTRWNADPAILASTRNGRAFFASNLRKSITAICEEAGVDRIVPYELRHTAITFQCDSGADTPDVADWAGTSVRMIDEVYRHRLHDVAKLTSIAMSNLGLPARSGEDTTPICPTCGR